MGGNNVSSTYPNHLKYTLRTFCFLGYMVNKIRNACFDNQTFQTKLPLFVAYIQVFKLVMHDLYFKNDGLINTLLHHFT